MLLSIKKFAAKITNSFSTKFYLRLSYLHNRHRLLSLKNPRDLSEIWIKWMLEGGAMENYYLADKFKVRSFVQDKGLGYILTPLISAYDQPNEIDYPALPNKFALKMNYGAGMNIICTDKSKLDVNDVNRKLNLWLGKAHTYSKSEQHYNLIDPKIICEEFIDDGSGNFPTDYKFICLKGRVACILVMTDRDTGKPTHARYTRDWKPLPEYSKGDVMTDQPKPKNIDEMIKVAETLSSDIDLVRVDLYSNGEKIWFGEMTLTPAGCIFHSWSQKALNDLGKFYRTLR